MRLEDVPDPSPKVPGDEIRIGVSSCLLGEEVRFDGGHKHDRWLTGTLGPMVTWVPVCPEVGVGMSIPRETVRLEGHDGTVRMVAPRSGTDFTEAMETWSRDQVETLRRLDLAGYVLKRGSPSCGMERVKLYEGAMPGRTGVGLFAAALMHALPLLPVEEEGRLRDYRLRENFLERVFAWRRLRGLFDGAWTAGQLVSFHTREKYLLLCHDPERYRTLGRLVARVADLDREEVAERYQVEFMTALRTLATRGRHVNTLQHLMGYFRDHLPAETRQEILSLIDDYGRGEAPLIVPLTLIRHYVRIIDEPYLKKQSYLDPHPKELMLRSYV